MSHQTSTVGLDASGEVKRGLRILMIAPQPFFRARGTPFSVLHRIRALIESGHVVDLVTYPFGEDISLPRLRIIRASRPLFVREVGLGPSFAKLLLDIPLYLTATRALRQERYDVLHTHEEAAFFGMRLARKHGIPHIYDMHSSLPQQLANFKAYDLGAIRRVFQLLETRVLTTCDGVITICAELADIAMAQCGATPHVMIENTGDDSKVFTSRGDDPRAQLGLRDKRIVLYTGTLEAYQGIDLLLRAFARVWPRHDKAHLLIVGGRKEQIDSYREQARALGIEAAVTFVGTVHPAQIPGFLNAAELIVSPRCSGNNIPLKIYGYMRSRRPLVVTDMPTHTQTLDGEVAYLAPPTDEGFASGISRLLDNPALSQQLAQAAAERAEELFSDKDYVGKVASFYERVMNQDGRAVDVPFVREARARTAATR